MPVSSNEPACPKFQPNIFDPSRCHDCLRQRHLHAGGGESKEATPQRSPSTVTGTGTGKITAAGDNPENGIGTLPGKGDALQPLPSQADERNTSGKEDSDGQSVRSSYCVSGGRQGFHESSLCILSPDCELYICDGDDDCSTDSGRDYPELSDSVSTENDYLPICRRPTQLAMTRLDPPPHHPNPRAWMEEARDRDSFSKYSGFKGERENRDSGYFSLGRAEGSRSFRDKSPPASFRHFERGHPVFNTRNIEPKDTIPFRNPNLGVASERTNMEVLDLDLPEEIFPPDPYDIAIEVEAQVGPRSPSPTPFKIAESLVSTGQRRVGGSYGRGSHSSSYQQSGRLESSRQGSTFQSRSSSPSRGQLPFRRSESTTSLNRNTFNDRGRSQGLAQGSRSPSQGTSGRVSSGTVPMNFKAFTSSAKSQPTTVSDFRNALRKTGSNGLMDSRSRDGRSSPSSRKDYNPTGQSSLRKTEQTRSLSTGQVRDSRNSSPSRRSYDSVCDGHSSLPTRRNCSLPSQTLLHKWDSVTSLSGGGHRRRCGSPIREGYDIESQILLRSPEARDDLKHDHPSLSPTGGGHDAPTHVLLRKTVSSGYGVSRGGESRSSSPGRRSYADPGRYQSRKTGDDCLYKSYVRESRTSSALKRTYDTPGQSLLWKSETSSSIRSGDARSLSPHRRGYDPPGQLAPRRTENISSLNSRCSSPSRKGNGDSPGYSVLNKISHVDTRHSYQRKGTYSEMRSDGNRSPRSWRDSTHSLRSSSVSRAASPSHSPTRETRENGRKAFSNRASSATREASRSSSVNRSISSGRGLEEGSPNSNAERSSRRMRSPSPPPRVQMRRHTSSQSSMESSESGQPLGGSAGRSREEYAVMADVPRVKMIHPREGPGYAAKPQSHRSPGRQELFKPASHSLSKHPSREWEDPGDMERECLGSAYTGSGHLSRAHSSTSLYMQGSGSPTVEEGGSWKGHRHRSGQMQPDLLNFKKGWMSKLDDNGEWKKHWFVLTDAGLKYYRDSGAEEKDELDGEIDLKSCVKVSEFDVEKNYGFQIQTREAVFTLSAMTAGIRRNWIEVLRKSVRPSSSPDLTQLPDSSSDKENSLHTRSLISSRRTTSRHVDARSEIPSPAPPAQRRFDSVELSPVPAPTGQREVGEGQGREHGQWQEERNRDATSSQWEALLSRKGSGSDLKVRVEEEIERKWVEFERMPLKEMRLLPPAGLRSTSQPGNEALQREVASLRQQLERRGGGRGEGGGGVSGSGCGPEAPCGRSLAAMERAHQQALEELRRQHDRQARELGAEQDRLLLEESRDTARVMEALKKAHKEELEREVEKAKRLGGGFADSTTLRNQQQAETQALQRELAGLSERYSQKCLELNRAEQANAERERELSRKERDMEQLRKENQDLQARLKEEMRSMSSVIAGQGSGVISNDKRNRTSCELEVLLRVKEHEVDYLHKEIGCLRNELQFLNTENRVACKRYTELHEELSGTKSRSEREIQGLKEHLRLAMAALQEGQMLGNSLDH